MAKSRQGKPAPSSGRAQQSGRHPIFGALKGMTFVALGVDLTEPADPEWGKVYDDVGPIDENVTRRRSTKKKGGLRLR
jgi:hypothetical protein